MRNFLRNRILFFAYIIWLIVGIFWSCHRENINIREMTPEEQFSYAKRLFDKKDYYKSKMQFTIVVLNNPGSRIIEEAQFYLAESYYNLKEYILAVSEYEKLIRSLPQSPFVDDARYKIGMCYVKLAPGYALDQEYTYKAISQFQQFLDEFPDSDLKPEVEKRLKESMNKLSKKVYKTGELYRKMGYYRAAIISFNQVLKDYEDTKFADDALYWKGECHKKLGEWEDSNKAFNDLLTKYNQSPYVDRAKNKLKEMRKKQSDNSQNVLGRSNL